MKKKEEILDDEFTRKWGNSFFGCAEGYTGEQFAQTAYPLIQKSMQTYADQECAEQKEKIEEQFVIELMAELNRIGVDTTKWDGDEDLVGTTAYCIKMAIEDERDKCASLREQLEAANKRIAELEKQVEVQAHLIVELRKIEDIAADLRRQLSECKAKARIGQGQEF